MWLLFDSNVSNFDKVATPNWKANHVSQVQLAKQAGCHVIGTCSTDAKAEFLKVTISFIFFAVILIN